MIRPVWAARTGQGLDPTFQAYSQSIDDDLPFLPHDLAGSVAHVMGLHKAGLLSEAEAAALVAGLQDLHQSAQDGSWRLDEGLEDIHMNIEAKLTGSLGDVAKRLHTGRSRNDQVATCITLYARHALAGLADASRGLAAALAAQAEAHAATPWVAKTHGQPAQPATLGFLLAAHAFRFQDLAKQSMQAFHAVGESPLGAGAVAGSTLPLDPAYTARLLGLRPLRNALLATGGRDTTLRAVQVASTTGLQCASLAQDLVDLVADKAVRLPDGFATGSSLMPQKRNPDALELARGHGKALSAAYGQAAAVVAGLGLGYQRDLQVVKPILTGALSTATHTLHVLATCVQGATFDTARLAASLDAPGITATDAAEALVMTGMSFREAYEKMAVFHALVEDGAAPDDALAQLELDAAQQEAVAAALVPDPSRRATHGGPAPKAVHASLLRFAQCQATLDTMTASAVTEAAAPAALLHGDAKEMVRQ